MQFTIQMPTDRTDAPDEFLSAAALAEMARSAEDAGFDALYVTDHPAPTDAWLGSGGHQTLDPFVALSFLAAATQRIRLQTHVLILPYRNPFLTAKALASLDLLSGGRVIAGVAAGYLEGEFEALGADFSNRNDVTDEHLRAIKRIWAEASLTLDGPDYHARAITALPRPVQQPHPPIWVGGNSRRAIRRAVELADGWLPFPNRAKFADRVRTASLETLDDLREKLDYARNHAESVGRTKPLDVVFVPFGLTMYDPPPADFGAYRDAAASLSELGVTWMTVGAKVDTRRDYRAWVERFATEVLGA
jgi:probable F420-dependent oxidoreductase